MVDKVLIGGKYLLNMQNIEIFIQRNFIKKFLTWDCVKTDKKF